MSSTERKMYAAAVAEWDRFRTSIPQDQMTDTVRQLIEFADAQVTMRLSLVFEVERLREVANRKQFP